MHRSLRERKKTKPEAEGEGGEIAAVAVAEVVAAEGVEGFRNKNHRRTFCLLHSTCFLVLIVNQMYKCCYNF